MKQGTSAPGWPPKPWTIECSEKAPRGPVYQAINLETGERGPLRETYGAAFKDIPKGAFLAESMYAEPWGV